VIILTLGTVLESASVWVSQTASKSCGR